MIVGLIIYGDIDTLTGGYLYDKLLADHLRKSGHEVHIISLPNRSYPKRILDNFIPLFSSVVSKGCDIVVQDELCHPSLLLLNRMLKRKTSIPIVTIVHQVLCDEPRFFAKNVFFSILEKKYLNSVDGFICNSAATQKTIQKLIRIKQPTLVAPPGGDRFGKTISDQDIRCRVTQPGPLKMLFLGNVIPRKGLTKLINALTFCNISHWRLEIVGSVTMDKQYHSQAQSLIKKHDLTDNIRFCGVINGTELARKMAKSHLLCMPYSYEGFGIVTLEAQSMGLPVIGSAAGATPELIEHGVNGYLLEPGDTAGLSEIIADLFEHPEKRVQMSLSAKQAYGRHPTWLDSLQSIEDFLQKMVR